MFIGALRYIKWDQLSAAQKDRLQKYLREQRGFIRKALGAVNQDLKTLARKPKRKPAAKKKKKTGRGRR